MKLSLMIINLLTEVFLDKSFRPKANPSIDEYENVLRIAHEAGYTAVDMTNMECQAFGASTVKKLMEKYELGCGSVIIFDNFTCIDPVMQAEVKARIQTTIDDTATIGGRTMMLVAAGAMPGLSRDELKQGLAQNLSAAIDYAKIKDITICIEDFPSTEVPMCAIDDIRYLLDNASGLKLTYDSANMLVEGATEKEFYNAFSKDIGYVHLKDVRFATDDEPMGDRLRDGRKMITTYHGKGIIDLKSAIERLEADNYDNYMSVEYAFDGSEEPLLDVLIAERIYLENLVK